MGQLPRKKPTLLCSFPWPEVLGEALLCLSVFSGTVPSPPTHFMSLTFALRGDEGHYGLQCDPCSRPHRLGGAPRSGRRLGFLAQSDPFGPRPTRERRPTGESLLLSCCLPNTTLSGVSSLPFLPPRTRPSDKRGSPCPWLPDRLAPSGSRPQGSFLSNFPLNPILR